MKNFKYYSFIFWIVSFLGLVIAFYIIFLGLKITKLIRIKDDIRVSYDISDTNMMEKYLQYRMNFCCMFIRDDIKNKPGWARWAETIIDTNIIDKKFVLLPVSGTIIECPADSNINLKVISTEVKSLKKEFNKFKNHILDKPETVLAIPLIKKEIEQIKNSYNSLEAYVDKMTTLFKWFMGSLVTIAIGLCGLFVTIILKAKE